MSLTSLETKNKHRFLKAQSCMGKRRRRAADLSLKKSPHGWSSSVGCYLCLSSLSMFTYLLILRYSRVVLWDRLYVWTPWIVGAERSLSSYIHMSRCTTATGIVVIALWLRSTSICKYSNLIYLINNSTGCIEQAGHSLTRVALCKRCFHLCLPFHKTLLAHSTTEDTPIDSASQIDSLRTMKSTNVCGENSSRDTKCRIIHQMNNWIVPSHLQQRMLIRNSIQTVTTTSGLLNDFIVRIIENTKRKFMKLDGCSYSNECNSWLYIQILECLMFQRSSFFQPTESAKRWPVTLMAHGVVWVRMHRTIADHSNESLLKFDFA